MGSASSKKSDPLLKQNSIWLVSTHELKNVVAIAKITSSVDKENLNELLESKPACSNYSIRASLGFFSLNYKIDDLLDKHYKSSTKIKKHVTASNLRKWNPYLMGLNEDQWLAFNQILKEVYGDNIPERILATSSKMATEFSNSD